MHCWQTPLRERPIAAQNGQWAAKVKMAARQRNKLFALREPAL
jgi:hypothetical protein